MNERAQQVLAYLQSNPVLCLGMAFVAGFAASKTVSYEGRGGIVLYGLVGLIGFFLSQVRDNLLRTQGVYGTTPRIPRSV
jgi:uncharacterized membrane protein YeaQ/YmgE (transglycosylase-associated protein family)